MKHLVIHCSATRPSQNVDAATIRRWHTQERGWSDIGYHYVIKRDGTIEKGRPENVAGAHVRGHNRRSLGICMAGGVSEQDVDVAEDNFTNEQWTALHCLLGDLTERYPQAKVVGHRDLNPGKDCPSFDVTKRS